MNEVKSILAQAEDLLRQAAGTSGVQAAELREKAMALLEQVKAQTSVLQEQAVQKAKEAGAATEEFVRENAWKAVGMAAGLGLLLGAMLKGDDKAIIAEKDITPPTLEQS